jgi:hypothetical protein
LIFGRINVKIKIRREKRKRGRKKTHCEEDIMLLQMSL